MKPLTLILIGPLVLFGLYAYSMFMKQIWQLMNREVKIYFLVTALAILGVLIQIT